MKLPRQKFLLLVLGFLVLNAAAWLWVRDELLTAARETVRIRALLPSGDADGAESFAILFDRPVGGPELADPERLFAIDPRPEGAFRWAGADRLEFVLDAPPPPGRVWTLSPTEDFAALTGWRIDEDDAIRFHTRAPAVEAVYPVEEGESDARLGVRFNQLVDPEELAGHLTVVSWPGEEDLEPEVLGTEPATTLRIRIRRPAEGGFRARVDGGLTGYLGNLPMDRKSTVTGRFPEAFSLTNVWFDGFRSSSPRPDRAGVELYFSEAFDRRVAVPEVRVEPSLKDLEVLWDRDSRSLIVEGEYRCGTLYTFTVPAGAPGKHGRHILEDQVARYRIPEREAEVRIPFDRGILSPAGNLLLDVDLVNAPRLKIRAQRVHAGNLVPHLMGLDPEGTSREVLTKTVAVPIPPNRMTRAALDLRGLFGEPRGLYLLEVSSADHRWTRDRAVVAVTDLAITAKRGGDGLTAWVTSIGTANPVPGARVRAITRNNQVLAEAETGEDGLARLEIPTAHPDGEAWVVTAEREGDLSYLRLDRNVWLLDHVDQAGRAHPAGYDLFLYPERGAYRPGETVHLTGLLRRPDGAVPPVFPLALTGARPDGHEAVVQTVEPGPEGFFHADVPLPPAAQTGEWTFRVGLPGAKRALGEVRLLVEEFVPARLEIRAEAAADLFGPGEAPRASVEARYLFDQPAAGLPLALTWRYRPEDFTSAAFPEHDFAASRSSDDEDGGEQKGALEPMPLDPDGRAEPTLPPPEGEERFRLVLTATVTEPGSRSVSRRFSTVVDRARRHVGLRPPEGFVRAGEPFEVSWVLRTPEDGPATPAALDWKLSRVTREWEVVKVEDRWTWRDVESVFPVETIAVPAEGAEGVVSLTAPGPGRYRLVVTDVETSLATAVEFLAASGEAEARSLAVNSAERLELVCDRESYLPGETAEVLVRSPFPGTLLVTVESEEVGEARVLVLEGEEITVPVPIPADARGGVFLSASVVRPLDPRAENWRPHRAAGLLRLATRHDAARLAVRIEAPRDAVPGDTVTVTARVEMPADGPPPVIHLFAVDEGILAVTDHPTPDPHGHFFAPRRAAVATADLFPDLLPDQLRPAGTHRIGGGGPPRGARSRRNPVPSRRREAAVIWRGAAAADAEGRLTAEFLLPKMEGALRLMAVAASGDRYGAADERLVLTRPLGVVAGWPRFLAPGDSATLPMKAFNRTGETLAVNLEATADGPITASFTEGSSLEVPPGESRTAWLRVTADGVGPAGIRVRAAGGEQVTEVEGTFPVRPAGPLHSVTRLLRLEPGESVAVPEESGFTGRTRREVFISGDPTVELRPAMEELLAYPYGCVEQTTSRLLAILHAPALIAADGESGGREEMARKMVEAGIARLSSMQTPSGGLAYWPGGGEASHWGTGYAVSFLVLARAEGYEAPDWFIAGLRRYLARQIEARGGDAPNANERALLARGLAAFGRPPTGWMERLSEQVADLDMAGRAHLAAAWHSAGRTDRALGILRDDTMGIVAATTTHGRLTSRTHQDGALLDALLTVEPEHRWVPELARRLLDRRTSGRWRSTLSNGAALSALARYELSRRGASGPYRVTLVAGEQTLTGTHEEPLQALLPPGPATVRLTGEGGATAVLRTEGLAVDGAGLAYDRSLVARREWFDAEGRPLEDGRVAVGDLVRVEVTLASPTLVDGEEIGNVVVVDALPAGFEPENPRLAVSAARGAARLSRADRAEFLSDRVLVFSTVSRRERRFAYHLRAITAGSFTVPPLQASCMYDPDVASVSGGGKLEVVR